VFDGDRLTGIVTTTDLLELIGRGVIKPAAESKRWTLRRRSPKRRPEPAERCSPTSALRAASPAP
jgi:hypothetical protein